MATRFDHEKLKVYQASIKFVAWTYELLGEESLPTVVKNQLARSSVSIPLNIAEGNGKSSAPDRCRYFEIARGSALESAAALDVLIATEAVSNELATAGKEQLIQIVSMLVGLIKAVSSNRLAETPEELYDPS